MSLLILNLLLLMVVVSGLYIVRQHWRCFLSDIMTRNQVVSFSKAHWGLLLLLLLLLLMVNGLLLVLVQRILLDVSVIIADLIRVTAVCRLVGTMRLTKGLKAMHLALSKILSKILLEWVVSPDRLLRVAWHLNQVLVRELTNTFSPLDVTIVKVVPTRLQLRFLLLGLHRVWIDLVLARR